MSHVQTNCHRFKLLVLFHTTRYRPCCSIVLECLAFESSGPLLYCTLHILRTYHPPPSIKIACPLSCCCCCCCCCFCRPHTCSRPPFHPALRGTRSADTGH